MRHTRPCFPLTFPAWRIRLKKTEDIEASVPKTRKRPVADSRDFDQDGVEGDSSGDLRVLLLILLLSVMVFFILLYKTKNPESYERSMSRVVQGAESAYATLAASAPDVLERTATLFRDASARSEEMPMPPELPKIELRNASPVGSLESGGDSMTESGTGTADSPPEGIGAGSWTFAEAPLVLEFSGYRVEFSEPPKEAVEMSAGGAKIRIERSAAILE